MLTRALPGLAFLRSYRRAWLRRDLPAGVTLWAMLVPQSLGFSVLAGLPPVVGLYAALGAMLLYWLWGSSPCLNVGAESTVAIMVATIMVDRAEAGSEDYVELTALLAILVGLVVRRSRASAPQRSSWRRCWSSPPCSTTFRPPRWLES